MFKINVNRHSPPAPSPYGEGAILFKTILSKEDTVKITSKYMSKKIEIIDIKA
jgi:hypothetical protein